MLSLPASEERSPSFEGCFQGRQQGFQRCLQDAPSQRFRNSSHHGTFGAQRVGELPRQEPLRDSCPGVAQHLSQRHDQQRLYHLPCGQPQRQRFFQPDARLSGCRLQADDLQGTPDPPAGRVALRAGLPGEPPGLQGRRLQRDEGCLLLSGASVGLPDEQGPLPGQPVRELLGRVPRRDSPADLRRFQGLSPEVLPPLEQLHLPLR